MADNYTALKSSQKKRYISEETFSSLDLSQIPVGSEYEVVSPIKKGDLSADINNALNKAEKSISEPTNQTTGSDGDVLVKKGGGSEWKSNAAFTDKTNEFSENQFFGNDSPGAPGGNSFVGTLINKTGVAVAKQTESTSKVEMRVSGDDGYVAVAYGGTIAGPNDVNGFQSTLNKNSLILANSRGSGAFAATLKYNGDPEQQPQKPVLYLPQKNGTLALTSDVDAKSSFSVEVW